MRLPSTSTCAGTSTRRRRDAASAWKRTTSRAVSSTNGTAFSHSPGTPALIEGARKGGYTGRLELGEDLMIIDVGDEVRVTRPQ